MAESRPRRVRRIFDRAKELRPEEREAFVQHEAAGDEFVVNEVFSLLRHAATLGGETVHIVPKVDPNVLVEQALLRRRENAWYSVVGQVGRGGMGEVFRVRDCALDRELAMKVLKTDSGAHARFLAEAKITSKLDHPGIVPIHEAGVDDQGRMYFTMKFIDGEHFGETILKARAGVDGWNPTRALGVLAKVCETVAFAHARGVLHRDIKPANVMVGKFGEVFVMDWGLAKESGRVDPSIESAPVDGLTVEATLHGTAMGTAQYMPPEQAAGEWERVGPWSDVYSMGAMLYHLLSGHPPHDDVAPKEPVLDRLRRIQAGPPTAIGELAGEHAPVELIAICERAMAHDERERYQTADSFGADLRAFLEGRPIVARAPRLAYLAAHLFRRYRVAILSTAVVILALTGSGYWAAKKERAQLEAFADFATMTALSLDAQGKTNSVPVDVPTQGEITENSYSSMIEGLCAQIDDEELQGTLIAAASLIAPAISVGVEPTDPTIQSWLTRAWTIADSGSPSSKWHQRMLELIARTAMYGRAKLELDSGIEKSGQLDHRNRSIAIAAWSKLLASGASRAISPDLASTARFSRSVLIYEDLDQVSGHEQSFVELAVEASARSSSNTDPRYSSWSGSTVAWLKFTRAKSMQDALDAISSLEEAVDLDKGGATAFSLEQRKRLGTARYQLAKLLESQKNKGEARRHFEKGLAVLEDATKLQRMNSIAENPVAWKLRFETLNCLTKLEEFDQAMSIADEMIAAYPETHPLSKLATQARAWVIQQSGH